MPLPSDYPTHEPGSLRSAVTAILVSMRDNEDPMPSEQMDERTVLPVVDTENVGEFLAAVRRALIHGGIGKEAD